MKSWKRAKDILPKYNCNVLACNVNGISSDERGPFIAHLDEDLGWVYINMNDYDDYSTEDVTHWMDMPDVPRLSTDDDEHLLRHFQVVCTSCGEYFYLEDNYATDKKEIWGVCPMCHTEGNHDRTYGDF